MPLSLAGGGQSLFHCTTDVGVGDETFLAQRRIGCRMYVAQVDHVEMGPTGSVEYGRHFRMFSQSTYDGDIVMTRRHD